jgi:hypothetical protein
VNGREQKRERAVASASSPALEMVALAIAAKNSEASSIRLAPRHRIVGSTRSQGILNSPSFPDDSIPRRFISETPPESWNTGAIRNANIDDHRSFPKQS